MNHFDEDSVQDTLYVGEEEFTGEVISGVALKARLFSNCHCAFSKKKSFALKVHDCR